LPLAGRQPTRNAAAFSDQVTDLTHEHQIDGAAYLDLHLFRAAVADLPLGLLRLAENRRVIPCIDET
jgi:hypothetical protein